MSLIEILNPTAEGIMALHDPALRALYDLKVLSSSCHLDLY